MAETTVPLRFPASGPAVDIGATVDSLLAFLLNIEKAKGDLGREREKKVAEKIDAFAAASKTSVSGVDALKARIDFDSNGKTYDEQEAALDFWEHQASDRLDRLTADYGDQVLAVLERRLAQLRQQEASEQRDVDAVKSLIAELETRRQLIQSSYSKGQQQKKGAAASKSDAN